MKIKPQSKASLILFFAFISMVVSNMAVGGEEGKKRERGNKPAKASGIKDSDQVKAQDVVTEENGNIPTESPELGDTTVSDDNYTKLIESISMDKEEEKEIVFHNCRNVSSTNLKDILNDFITAKGRVAASEESDIVIISDVKSNIDNLKKIADTVDTRVPQILVSAQIVEVTLDNDFEKEVNLSFVHTGNQSFIKEITSVLTTPGASPTIGEGSNISFRPYVKNYENGKRNELSSFFRYLETKGKAKILSAPNLILRRGTEGSIITGEEVPIQQQTVVSGSLSTSTVFKEVGIRMKVTPTMISPDSVRIKVNPEVSTVTGYSSSGEGGVENPIIAVRKATTELEVKDGQLISIGGLLRNEEREVKKRVPVASDIPIVGELFNARRTETVKTQLVIFLHIKILNEGEKGGVNIFHPMDFPDTVNQEVEKIQKDMQENKKQVLMDFEEPKKDADK